MVKVVFLIFLIFSLGGCAKTTHVSGHLFETTEIQALKKAKDKADINLLLGSPTSVSDFGQETWYYITTKKESFAFFKDKVLEQNIIAITFKNDSTIDSIARYNEKDANKSELSTEYTLIKGTQTTKAQRFFNNMGRFNKNKAPEPAKPRSGF